MIQTGFLKACNFYVSEWHLLAAMLPFVRDELKFKNQVIILSQDNLKKGILNLIQKINVQFYNTNGIHDVVWCRDYEEVEIENEINPSNIFIQGTIEFINEANQYLEEKFRKI